MISFSTQINPRPRISLLLLCLFCALSFSIGVDGRPNDVVRQNDLIQRPLTNNEDITINGSPQELIKPGDSKVLPAMLSALDVLQEDYFATWQGIYPTGIDWTSAVIGTILSLHVETTLEQELTPLSKQAPMLLVHSPLSPSPFLHFPHQKRTRTSSINTLLK